MATYSIQGDTLKGMADSIRAYKGENPDNPLEITHQFSNSDHPFYYNFPGAKSIKITIQEFTANSDLIGVPYKTNNDWAYMTDNYKEDAFFIMNKGQALPFDVVANNTEYITLNLPYAGAGIVYGGTLKMVIQAYDASGNLLPKVTKYTATDIANELSKVYSVAPKPEDLILSGDCTGIFSDNKFKWLRNKIKGTNNISSISNMFNGSDVETIDYSLNLATSNRSIFARSVFENCYNLKKIPDIIGLGSAALESTDKLFFNCSLIKEIPISWENINYTSQGYNSSRAQMFQNCYNLRKISENLIKKLNMKKVTYYFYGLGYNGFYYCNTLEEIRGFAIPNPDSTVSSNLFKDIFYYCNRLKNLIFLEEEGTRGNLQGQTIDLRNKIGYITSLTGDFPSLVDKSEFDLITDDESYQRFKNSENSFACSIEYSRYNHDSAVRTINSLPDLSGNTGAANTIIFKGEAGSRTDGGAINTMTEEEIAVATAKGWVVSFV